MISDVVAIHMAEVPLFSHLSRLELGTITRHAEIRDVDSGTVLVNQGSPGDAFYVILDGTAEVIREGEHVADAGPGTWFGELALLDGEPRSATVVAKGPVTVAVLDRNLFRMVLREFPDLTEQLLAAMAGQLRSASRP